MADQDQRLIEQICDNFGLPLSKVVPPTQPDTNWASLQPSNEPITDAQISNLSLPQGRQDTSLLDNGNQFTDFPTSETWEASPSDWSWQILNEFSGFSTANNAIYNDVFAVNQASDTSQQSNNLPNEQPESSSQSEDEAEADIVPRLAARLGSLRVGADGRLRYYGTASNHHFLGGSSFRPSGFDGQEMQKMAALALKNANLDQEISPSLQDHFIQLFFTCHNPHHSAVDKAMFTDMFAQDPDGQTEYCSQALIAAM
jgi:hypothetical protein